MNGLRSDSVEVYDGARWSVLDSPLSKQRWNHGCGVWEGKIAVLGGNEVDVEVYDEVEKEWRSDIIPRLSIERFQLCAVSFGF